MCSDRKTYQRGGSGRFHAGPGSGGVGVGEQPVDLPQWDASSSIADLGEDNRQLTFDPEGGSRAGGWGGSSVAQQRSTLTVRSSDPRATWARTGGYSIAYPYISIVALMAFYRKKERQILSYSLYSMQQMNG